MPPAPDLCASYVDHPRPLYLLAPMHAKFASTLQTSIRPLYPHIHSPPRKTPSGRSSPWPSPAFACHSESSLSAPHMLSLQRVCPAQGYWLWEPGREGEEWDGRINCMCALLKCASRWTVPFQSVTNKEVQSEWYGTHRLERHHHIILNTKLLPECLWQWQQQ